MNQKHYLLKGTFLLTAAGAATRFLGFFYRIFLSRTIGAEGIGIYHLILPVYSFCMAASSGGIQTAISRFCAERFAQNDRKGSDRILAIGLALSISVSILTASLLYYCADMVAISFLAEPRCAPLLRIVAISLPFSVIHACISGYFIGKKQVSIPAISQFAEQLFRIGAVLLFYTMLQKDGRCLSPVSMAFGQAAGELAASLYCTFCYLVSRPSASVRTCGSRLLLQESRRILAVSSPLGLNRMLICVLQGIEAALLPQQLIQFGLNSSDALSMYGTLTGMTLPLLLFPTAITGAVGTLLLPAVSEARVLNHQKQLSRTIEATFRASFLLGLVCFNLFCLFGTELGTLLFHNQLAGHFIQMLAWICPFLYLNTTLVNILHGLDKTFAVSLQNSLGFGVRLASVIFLVPQSGIEGYFTGLFASQLLIFTATLFTLHRSAPLQLPVFPVFLKPLAVCSASSILLYLIKILIPPLGFDTWGSFILCGLIYIIAFSGLSAVFLLPDWLIPPKNRLSEHK